VGVKLKPDERAEFTNALQRRPHLASLIGLAIAEYANAEMIMAIVFATLLGVEITIGTSILDAIFGKNQKRNHIMAVARAKIKDPDLLKRIDEAVARVSDLGPSRDNMAHGKWSTCDSERFKDKLLWQKTTWSAVHGYELYDEPGLAELVNRIIHHRNVLQLLIIDIAKYIKAI